MVWLEIIYYLLVIAGVFFIGACVGSFLNVLLYRKSRGEDWIAEKSHCEKCNYVLHWYDNIPLISWVILQGKCRKCRAKIDIIHPVMEVMTGLLFLWWWVMGSWFFRLTQHPLVMLQPAFWLITGLCLVVIFLIDWQQKIIPNWLNSLLGVWILGYHLILSVAGAMQWRDFGLSLITAVAAGGIFYGVHLLGKKIYQREAFGMGDVKLIAVLGLLLGWQKLIVALFVAFGLGSLVGVGLMMLDKKYKRKSEIAFGPFLVAGALVALLFGAALFRFLFVF